MKYYRGDRVAVMEANSTRIGKICKSHNDTDTCEIIFKGDTRVSYSKSRWIVLIERGKEIEYVDDLLSLVE